VKERNVTFVHKNLLNDSTKVPSEMLYASASGLDPHISPRAALLQVDRIAKARGFNKKQTEKLYALIDRMTEMPQFHLFGEKRINVFMLNLELDKI
jgi:K+-transporting ATPase ATPase C chain